MNAISKPDYQSIGQPANFRLSYRRIIEQCSLAFFILGNDGRIKHSSDRACRLLDRSSRDVLNRFPADLAHPDDQAMIAMELKGLSRLSASERSIECRFSTPQESHLHVELHASRLADEEGDSVTMIVVTDINEKKKLERSLVETRRKLASRDGFLHSILTSTSSLILTLDRSARITFLNETAIDCLESTPADLVGQSLFELISPDSVPKFARPFWPR